jgi:hypothetical protein
MLAASTPAGVGLAAGGNEFGRPPQYGGVTGPEQVASFLAARSASEAAAALALPHPSAPPAALPLAAPVGGA